MSQRIPALYRRSAAAALSLTLVSGGILPLAALQPPPVADPTAKPTTTSPQPPANTTSPGQGTGQGRGNRGGRGGRNQAGGFRVTPTQGDGRAAGQPPITTPTGGIGQIGAGTTFTFDYRAADIMNVLRFYAQASGLNVTVDPGLSGSVTIINPKPVNLEEAFKILQSVLLIRGYTAVRDGTVLSVIPFQNGPRISPLVSSGLDANGKPITNPENQIMTQVIPLENVDAEALAKELDPLKSVGASLIGSPGTNSLIITDTASNIERFIKMVDALDKTANNTELKVYPLKRAEASNVSDIINNLYGKISPRGRGATPQPGQPQPQPGQPASSSARPAVVAVPDIRTNTVIVVASPDNQEQVARTIIARLDDDDSNTLDTKIRKLKYGDAQQVANLVNTVLTNQRSSAATGQQASFGQRNFGGFNPFGGGQQDQQTQSTDPFGKVAADPRTNTLLISATPERMRKIDELIDQLDVDVPIETTTFVLPLENAQAIDVATALAQAFGTTQNSNSNAFSFFGGGGNQNSSTTSRTNRRQPVQRLFNSGSAANANATAGRAVPPPNAPGEGGQQQGQAGTYNGQDGGSAVPSSQNGVAGVMTPNGFVPYDTNAKGDGGESPDRTRQFFFGGGGGQRGLGQATGLQYGRGTNGSYANLLQLQNNVYVVPSPGGDSVIVTTTPSNIQAVRDIIKQLDVVQRQVQIEVIVAEVTLDQDQKFGFSLGGQFQNLFNKVNSAGGSINLPAADVGSNVSDPNFTGGQFSITGVGYSALVQALNSDNKVKVLSTPRIFTSNNESAQIQIVTSIPYITGTTASSVSANISSQVEFQNIGFNLNVLPVITRGGQVTIDVAQEASDLLRFQTLGTGANAITAPVANVRFANTLVTVQDGETVAIGGLIRDSQATNIVKVPIIGEIPLIGQFFRSHQKTRSRSELVIFMTPRIVSSVKEARDMTLKMGRGVVKDIPDLRKEQPNLDVKNMNRPSSQVRPSSQPK